MVVPTHPLLLFTADGGDDDDNAGDGHDADRQFGARPALTVNAAPGPVDDPRGPAWLPAFIHISYFVQCECPRRSMVKHFCIYCHAGLCKADSEQLHRGHPCLQVRKASYEYSINQKDIHPFINLTDIQCFTINGNTIVFIKQRSPQENLVIATSHCVVCNRSLMGKKFCSIQCKFRAILAGDLSQTMVGTSCESMSRHSTVNQHLHYVGHAKSGKATKLASQRQRKSKAVNKSEAVLSLPKIDAGWVNADITVNAELGHVKSDKVTISNATTSIDRSSPESEVLNVAVNEDDATSAKVVATAKRRKSSKPAKSPSF